METYTHAHTGSVSVCKLMMIKAKVPQRKKKKRDYPAI